MGRTSSLGELCPDGHQGGASSTQSLNVTQRLGSIFNPLRWSRRDVNDVSTPKPLQKNPSRNSKGPAARKCNRSSGGSLTRPQSISPASSVFFMPPTEDGSSDVSAEEAHHQQQQQYQQQPVLASPSRQRQAPQSPRFTGHAGIRPQLLPSQLTPAAF